jgi:prophage regulatory protein
MEVQSSPQSQFSKILRLRQVIAKTGLARSTIYDLIKRESFPKPIKLAAKIVGWLENEIEEWISAQIKKSRGGKI